MKRQMILLLAGALLTGCEKEITMDYRSVDKLYVIEGKLSDSGSEVLITRTRDMSESDRGACVEGAEVRIAGDDGTSCDLFYDTGSYRPFDPSFAGRQGVAYTLEVAIGEDRFTSSSTMLSRTAIESVEFNWQKIFGNNKLLICTISIGDTPQQENYYHYTLHINRRRYRWNVLKDRGNDGLSMLIDIPIADDTGELLGDENEGLMLEDGDWLFLEVQSIDRRTYDYLYSLSLSDRTSSNPISNFSGGCLGYFAAYTSATTGIVFDYDDVQ